MKKYEYLSDIIQICTTDWHYWNSLVTALCKDWTVWQKSVWPSRFWECINCPEENQVSE